MSITYLNIGGLIAVGFDPDERYLLAISHTGRGVFSTATRQRLARNDALAYPKDGYGVGIGPIDGMTIAVIEMYWEGYSEKFIESPSGRIRLRCESSGIDVLASLA